MNYDMTELLWGKDQIIGDHVFLGFGFLSKNAKNIIFLYDHFPVIFRVFLAIKTVYLAQILPKCVFSGVLTYFKR